MQKFSSAYFYGNAKVLIVIHREIRPSSPASKGAKGASKLLASPPTFDPNDVISFEASIDPQIAKEIMTLGEVLSNELKEIKQFVMRETPDRIQISEFIREFTAILETHLNKSRHREADRRFLLKGMVDLWIRDKDFKVKEEMLLVSQAKIVAHTRFYRISKLILGSQTKRNLQNW